MKILIVLKGKIPVVHYGGTERVAWYLGKYLHKIGHDVSFLVKGGSFSDFAKIHIIDDDESIKIAEKIESTGNYDIVHFHSKIEGMEQCPFPWIFTLHGNARSGEKLPKNTVFLSKDHAKRHGGTSYVYNGLGWEDYNLPTLNNKRTHFHFLGNAAWSVKNVRGAIKTILKTPDSRLQVLGGSRLNFKMGFRYTFSRRIQFNGMVGGRKKLDLINQSKGLLFPVLWSEPFGLALIESLFLGCPVFGTPYGSLTEIVTPEVGFLSNNSSNLAAALQEKTFDIEHCHEYAKQYFGANRMAKDYEKIYNQVVLREHLKDKDWTVSFEDRTYNWR